MDSPILSADRVILQSLPKPLKFYMHKSKASRFSKMDASLIAEDVPVISAPPIVPLVFGLSPSSGAVGLSRLFSSGVAEGCFSVEWWAGPAYPVSSYLRHEGGLFSI